MKSAPWTKPKLGLAPRSGPAEPADTLYQFQTARRALEHCNMIMKEMESGRFREGASMFRQAAQRLLTAAQSFESMQTNTPGHEFRPEQEPEA